MVYIDIFYLNQNGFTFWGFRGDLVMKKYAISRRKKLLINREFQIPFLAYTSGICLVILAIFFAANQYFFWKFTQQGLSLGLPPNHTFFVFLGQQKMTMNIIYIVSALLVITATAYYGLYLSNRVAGPLYRLQMHLRNWMAGDRNTVLRFRKNDFFQDIAISVDDALNESKKLNPNDLHHKQVS